MGTKKKGNSRPNKGPLLLQGSLTNGQKKKNKKKLIKKKKRRWDGESATKEFRRRKAWKYFIRTKKKNTPIPWDTHSKKKIDERQFYLRRGKKRRSRKKKDEK